MRISNRTGEQVVIEPGAHVDVQAGVIRKDSGKLMEVVVNGTY